MRRSCIATVFTAGWAIAQSPDPLAAATANDVASGKRVFDSQCALCHGIGGAGGRGPGLEKAEKGDAPPRAPGGSRILQRIESGGGLRVLFFCRRTVLPGARCL